MTKHTITWSQKDISRLQNIAVKVFRDVFENNPRLAPQGACAIDPSPSAQDDGGRATLTEGWKTHW